MNETEKREAARMAVSRHAVALFLARGVAATSGDDIATAAGLSTRTVWRYFRSKESCVEPLLSASAYRIVTLLKRWPNDVSLEDYLHAAIKPHEQPPQEISDDIATARILALLPSEPALRSAWLMACSRAEDDFVHIVARRARRPAGAIDVRLCTATVSAAIRVVNEDISEAAMLRGVRFTLDQVVDQLAAAIRDASTLPICDPIAS